MKASKINFIASVHDDQLDNIKQIAKKLKDMGCTIDNVLSISGIITGSTSANTIGQLKIQGVKNVELDKKVKAI